MKNAIRHICLADDDSDDYLLFSSSLEDIDNTVQFTWCSTGEKLLEFLRTTTELPDLILLDLNMPTMDGPTCLKKLKADPAFSHVPVVMFSTASSPAIVKQVEENGALKYVLKPHSIAGYKEIILDLLSINMGY
jgi:Response regulator containing CheY-like receiver, AAA-type ATPase, and DNA-binding domains